MDYVVRSFRDVRIRIGVAGSGPDVVLVHGSWDDHRAWREVAAALSDSYRVIVYDRRGHGESTVPDGQGRISEDIDDLAAVIAAVAEGPAHLVGHSYGACIALRLAAEQPELLDSVALHEPPLFGVLAQDPGYRHLFEASRDGMIRAAARIEQGDPWEGARTFAEEVALHEQTWEEVLDGDMRRTWVANAHTWLDQSRDPERLNLTPDLLADTRLRVLVTSGGRSPPAFRPGVEQLVARTPDARHRVLEKAGHFPQLTHATDYAGIVADFLAGNDNST